MKLITLLLIIGVIVVLYFLICSSKDYFTPSPYQISWQAPTNNGGDPKCCGYDWQICTDATCTTIVDSGTTNELMAQTTKLDWATTYNVWVRATNVSGKGEWTKAVLSTGDGVVSSISIGNEINPNGTVKIPLSSSGPINVAIWTSLEKGSVDPNTLVGIATVTATRSGTQLFSHNVNLASSSSGAVNVFQGDFASAKIPLVAFQKGDAVSVDIYIVDNKGDVVTEARQDTTVTKGVPGSVTGITLIYSATPPPIPLTSKYQRWIDVLYTQNPSPYSTVTQVAAEALTLYNEMPAPTTPRDYQTKMSLFFLSQLKWVAQGKGDGIWRGIGYFYVLLNSMGWDNSSIGAAFYLYRMVPADPTLAASLNNGSGIDNQPPNSPTYSWGPNGLNPQSYFSQIQTVLQLNSQTFSPNLSLTPGTTCPTISNCMTCQPVTNAPIGTNVCSGSGNRFTCTLTSDNVTYWNMGSSCTCSC